MRLVIDASAAIYELVSADGIRPLEAANDLVAPSLMWSEVTSVLNETAWRGEITGELADIAFARLCDCRVRTRSDTDVYAGARRVAAAQGWAKTYDAEYVGIAVFEDIPLYTRDGRLARSLDGFVRVVGPDDVPRSS